MFEACCEHRMQKILYEIVVVVLNVCHFVVVENIVDGDVCVCVCIYAFVVHNNINAKISKW